MRVLDQFISVPETCHYLPDRYAAQEYLAVSELSPPEYEALMNRGWRKFGLMLFRPVCAGCTECRPIRILADRFVPDRSQQRAWRKNADLTIKYARPAMDADRLELYRRYHAAQAVGKGWPDNPLSETDYTFQFVQNPIPGIEISIWQDSVLRGVALTDITPNAVSGVYHFHDPDCRERSLGTFAMLHTIELARRLEKRWAYFGYYVAGCGSMRYKARFQPNEILGADGNWRAEPGIIHQQYI